MRPLALLLLLFIFQFSQAQKTATSPDKVMNALRLKTEMEETSLVKNLPLKNIGPSVMSGRVVDLEVNPDNPTEFYVAYASGGLWHTQNNGISFTPILDNSKTQKHWGYCRRLVKQYPLGGYWRK